MTKVKLTGAGIEPMTAKVYTPVLFQLNYPARRIAVFLLHYVRTDLTISILILEQLTGYHLSAASKPLEAWLFLMNQLA